ncbi:MAG TPA: glycosyltransferase, partial [Anaerolineae bacterium]|nr:glycosyltransferase [Anaerolineae bacterium]
MAWLAVVIVSWNVRDLLARALESLFADLDPSSIGSRVVVVDNASRDGSVEMLRSRFARVELIALERNLGFAGGNNVGLRALDFSPSPRLPVSSPGDRQRGRTGEGEFVLLLNPDTEVQPGAIRTLLDAIRARPD